MKRKSVPTSMHKKKELADSKYNRKKAKKDLNSRIKEYYK